MKIKELADQLARAFEDEYGENNVVNSRRVKKMCQDIVDCAYKIEARKAYYSPTAEPVKEERFDEMPEVKRSVGRPRKS